MSLEDMKSENLIPGKYDYDMDYLGSRAYWDAPVTLEVVRDQIEGLMTYENDWVEAVNIGMCWECICCPFVFGFTVREYWHFDCLVIGVFFNFEDDDPSSERMENIAIMQGHDDMKYTSMTLGWKKLVAKHVVGIVEVAFEGNYYPGDVWFFEERTGDLPVEVLLAAALRD